MTYNIQTITPTAIADPEEARPVHIQYGDVKMDLPRLDDSANLPTSVIIVGLTAVSRGWKNLTQEEKINFMATILAYLVREYPLIISIHALRECVCSIEVRPMGAVLFCWTHR